MPFLRESFLSWEIIAWKECWSPSPLADFPYYIGLHPTCIVVVIFVVVITIVVLMTP